MQETVDQATLDKVRDIFTTYLVEHSHRRTPERFAILKEIYSHQGHFDVETLYIFMKNKESRVSRATLYNTLELLIDCGLLIKHQFGRNIAHYERALGCGQHDHMICTSCGRLIEFCDPRLQAIQDDAAALRHFEVSHHSLYIYGTCAECAAQQQGLDGTDESWTFYTKERDTAPSEQREE